MHDPFRALAMFYLQCRSIVLLAAGVALSALQFVAFVQAARNEGMLRIAGGVGFLDNYGLLSTLFGNAVLPYIVRCYYQSVHTFADSKAVKRCAVVDSILARLANMALLRGRYQLIVYGLSFVGLLFWMANTGFHVFGNPEARWGYKVFDSIDHPIGFALNRLNNFYTWMVVLPVCGYMLAITTGHLVRAVNLAADRNAIRYDLLNPDRCGGFAPVERAHLLFNIIVALVYVEIVLHIGTFMRMNAEHMLAYACATLLLLFGNTLFLGSLNRRIKTFTKSSNSTNGSGSSSSWPRRRRTKLFTRKHSIR